MPYILGLDLGTTGCKAMVFDDEGTPAGDSYIEYPLIVQSDAIIEQDAGLWWKYSKQAIAESVCRAGISMSEISVLSVSSQGLAFVPVDSFGCEISHAISWLDTRAKAEIAEILSVFPESELFRITGKRASAMYTLPKLMWLQKHKPALYGRAVKFLLPHDYIISRFSGEAVTDHSLASGTLLYDIRKQTWSRTLARSFGISLPGLSRLAWAGSPVGTISDTAARETGLPENLLVVCGGQDQKTAAYGAGLDASDASVSMGTASAIEFRCGQALYDPQMGLPCFSYLEEKSWVLEGVIPTFGAAIKWARDTLAPGTPYSDLDSMAGKAGRGSGGLLFYPHLAGTGSPEWQENARGSLTGLSLHTSREDVFRAIFEGLAFNIHQNIEHAGQLGIHPGRLHVFGGAARSHCLCGILADVTGLPVRSYGSPEFANLGAAKLAAKGAGFSTDGFGGAMLSSCRDREPDPQAHREYRDLYGHYLQKEARQGS